MKTWTAAASESIWPELLCKRHIVTAGVLPVTRSWVGKPPASEPVAGLPARRRVGAARGRPRLTPSQYLNRPRARRGAATVTVTQTRRH
jgi:hypothetical protein